MPLAAPISSESARVLFPVPIAGEFPIPPKFPARYSRTMTTKLSERVTTDAR